MELALWLHDVVYDPHQKNNELESALYAAYQLKKLGLPAHCVQQVRDLILVTQHPSNPLRYDEKVLVDIDLSILGADAEIFMQYEKNIRQEYCWVDDIVYCKERAKILQDFLVQKQLYQTDYFFEQKEQLARCNLENLIIILREQISIIQ